MKTILSALTAVLLLSACSNTRKTAANTSDDQSNIVNKQWTLFQLEGKPITKGANQEQAAYFKLTNDSKVMAHSGCNGMGGEYKLEPGNRIRFSNMLGTLRYCEEVPWEADYNEVFTLADNYTVHKDTLWLNVGRRAPLAGFVSR